MTEEAVREEERVQEEEEKVGRAGALRRLAASAKS